MNQNTTPAAPPARPAQPTPAAQPATTARRRYTQPAVVAERRLETLAGSTIL